jgi:hypothetical protein
MPETVTAVQCAHCKKLHPVTSSYIIVTNVEVREKADDAANSFTRNSVQSVKVADKIVCDNECLAALVWLGKERR